MQLFTNNADSALNGAIADNTTSITVVTGDGAKFPSPTGGDFFLLTLFQKLGASETNHEIVKCTARAGDVLTVVRAQEGTTAKAFNNADPVELRVTAGTLASKADAATTQSSLVSGTNIKTVNGGSILGSGNLVVGDVTLTGAQTLTNKTLTAPVLTGAIYDNGSVRSNIVDLASGTNFDCSAGNYFIRTVNGNVTFTVSNVPASRAYAFTTEIVHTSGTITWFAGVQWPGGTAPSLTTGKTHLFTFVTDDGGARWRAVANINYTT